MAIASGGDPAFATWLLLRRRPFWRPRCRSAHHKGLSAAAQREKVPAPRPLRPTDALPAETEKQAFSTWSIPSERIPGEYVTRAVERHERVLQRRQGMLGDGFRGPARGAMQTADRARRAEQIDLVHPRPKDLAGDAACSIGGEEHGHRRILVGRHLLDLGDPCPFLLGACRDRLGHAAPRPG